MDSYALYGWCIFSFMNNSAHHLLTFLNWHFFFFLHLLSCLSTGERVLAPVPERWPGGREAEPLHQRQLRPRLQRLPELLCCDRYNLTRAALLPNRANTAAVGQRRLQPGGPSSSVFTNCFMRRPPRLKFFRKPKIWNTLFADFSQFQFSPILSAKSTC